MTFYAHSNPDSGENWQTLPVHLGNVARIAADAARIFGLENAAFAAGLLHDLGKYDPAFQRYIRKEGKSVDHSTAGAQVLMQPLLTPLDAYMARIIAHAILGHHAGLPDTAGPDPKSLEERIKRTPKIDPAWQREIALDLRDMAPPWLQAALSGEHAGFALSFMGRMIFSCLIDADRRDTETYYASLGQKTIDRDWPALQDLLPDLQARFRARIDRFGPPKEEMAQLRADILAHILEKAELSPGLFTLTVPTGGGKTLASLGFALDHARRHGKRRIIYAIPFTSIIDQTAAIFREVLGGDIVLEHHSAIDEEEDRKREARESRDKLKLAMEDWAAPVVVTTNVQFFESLFSARPTRSRKLNNIANAVIVLDEAQTIPRDYLIPCMRALEELTRHYGCTVVLCTATQPALGKRGNFTFGLPLEGRELAPDPTLMAEKFARTRIVHGGEMDNAALVDALRNQTQALVIVNSRRHALELYEAAKAQGLDGLVHLTTRQYPAHRKRVLDDVRQRLEEKQACRLIATSLIEAGVDVDFPIAFRAEAGLDQIIQAAGRVNRNGKNQRDASLVTIFKPVGYTPPAEIAQRTADMKAMMGKHLDLTTPAAIEDYFDEVYWRVGAKGLDKKGILGSLTFLEPDMSFAYRSVGEVFRFIESPLVPVIVAIEPEAQEAVEELKFENFPSGKLARQLQAYIVQIGVKAREALRQNGKGCFEAEGQRGDQFFVLSDRTLYDGDTGLDWDNPDYLAVEHTLM